MPDKRTTAVLDRRRSGAAGPHITPKGRPRAQRERDARNDQERNPR